MEQTPQARKVEQAISPTAQSMGYEIVRVMMVGAGSGKPTLQIMAEKPDGTMNLDDCSRLSQAVSAVLDVENVIDAAYYLEVSSPGIDRPLTRLKDFERYKGFDVRIELDVAVNGQKKFKGKLLGATGDTVNLQTEEGPVQALPFGQIQKAKLLLTDDLIKAAQKKG
jgi:ribosome maturation factor RimP